MLSRDQLGLPRLSVDIDLNYVGGADRATMLAERPRVEQALEQVFGRSGLAVKKSPTEYAGGKWRLSYTTALGRSGTEGEHQIRPINSIGLALSRPSPRPDDGDSIRGGQSGRVVDATKLVVTLGLHDSMNTGHTHIMTLPPLDPLADLSYRHRQVGSADAYAEDVEARDHALIEREFRTLLATSVPGSSTQDGRDGEQEDAQVGQEADTGDVGDIDDHVLVHRPVAALGHLPQAGDPRLDAMTLVLPRLVGGDDAGEFGPRPDHAHRSTEHVPQLRQLVQAPSAKKTAQTGQAGIVGVLVAPPPLVPIVRHERLAPVG